MKIKFLQDFQGVETQGVFYRLGQVVDIDNGLAPRLIADKRAELVEVPTQPDKQIVTDETQIIENVYIAPRPTASTKRGRK